ncbi:MAG: NAD+ synthase [Ignavibacteria bacterium]|nr:NAD+ synthase [Ignavibacteria bacterium]
MPVNQDLVKVLVDFIQQETTRFGLKKVVLGLSGGIDSTVAAYLAVRALGPKNVLGVMMPYKTSSADSVSDALAVVKDIKLKSMLINLTGAVDALAENDPDILKNKVRFGNIMARMRMICLYDQSNEKKALVLGTGNKTEILLGYSTLYGDSASAINPLGDLYKTQVWQLAELLKCPKQIIKKKPSADLWSGQTDEGELGFTYREADELLYYMIDQRYNDDELVEMGFAPSFIKTIRGKIRFNQFKRVPPIIAKVSNRTINIDFRYNRDWGS